MIEKVGGLASAMETELGYITDPELAEACRIAQAARRLWEGALAENFSRTPVSTDDPRLIDYLRSRLAGSSETLCAMFLDKQGRYIRDERLAEGSIGKVKVSARALFARAFQLQASCLMVAHNHPSGDCRPSADDLSATKSLAEMGRALDVPLIDHLIIGQRGYFSFSKGGLL